MQIPFLDSLHFLGSFPILKIYIVYVCGCKDWIAWSQNTDQYRREKAIESRPVILGF